MLIMWGYDGNTYSTTLSIDLFLCPPWLTVESEREREREGGERESNGGDENNATINRIKEKARATQERATEREERERDGADKSNATINHSW